MKLEVIVFNIESARMAELGGADRVELCENAADGGTTPSYGTIAQAKKALTIDIFVMIRPRGGDFCYSDAEFDVMKDDIQMCKDLGVAGVVFGILNPDGTLDSPRCNELIQLARPMKVHCHRAFDMARDAFETLENCIELGFDRILTSGGRAQAVQGAALLKELRQRANGRIGIIAGSGVNEENVASIVEISGVEEIHFQAYATSQSRMEYRNPHIAAMGQEDDAAFKIRTVDPERVRTTRKVAEAAQSA